MREGGAHGVARRRSQADGCAAHDLAEARESERQLLIAASRPGRSWRARRVGLRARHRHAPRGRQPQRRPACAGHRPRGPVAGPTRLRRSTTCSSTRAAVSPTRARPKRSTRQQLESPGSDLARVNSGSCRRPRATTRCSSTASRTICGRRSSTSRASARSSPEAATSCVATLADGSVPAEVRDAALAIVDRDFARVDSLHPDGGVARGDDHRRPAALVPRGSGRVSRRQVEFAHRRSATRCSTRCARPSPSATRASRCCTARHDPRRPDGGRADRREPAAQCRQLPRSVAAGTHRDRDGVARAATARSVRRPERWLARTIPSSSVRDNGSGIPPGTCPRSSSPSSACEPAKAAGEGIGLTLVRRMVERHDGAIWVESTEGVGSTFYVALPARAGHEASEPSRTRPPWGMTDGLCGLGRAIRILLAEDDDGHATLVERNLRRAGLPTPDAASATARRCSTTCCGEAFARWRIRRLRAPARPQHAARGRRRGAPPDQGRLRARRRSPRSCSPRPTTRARSSACYQLGCNVYVTKPVDYEAFIEAIRRLGFFLQIVKVPMRAERSA